MANVRVLLAESSEFVVELLKDFLRESAVDIFVAHDGDEVLHLAAKLKPALIVLEKHLPVRDGLACCRTLKQDPTLGDTPILLLIDAATPAEVKRCKSAGCDEVLPKPLDRRAFLGVCRDFLARVDRREPRLLCRATVVCRNGADAFYGSIEDVSPRGMFIGSEEKVKAGDEFQLKFVLPWDEGKTIETAARVTWCNGTRSPRKSKMPRGFGVEFVDLDEATQDAICDYLGYILLRRRPLE